LKVFRKDVAVVQAGQNAGINIRNVKADDLSKGMMLCKPGSFTLTNHFEVSREEFNQLIEKLESHFLFYRQQFIFLPLKREVVLNLF